MAKFEYMQRAFSSELKPRARLVLQVLVLHCNKEGECFPSIKTIAAKCGYGVSTVKRALDELVKAGYIVKQARFDERKNGGQTSNLYTLCSDLLCPDEPENAPVLEDDASDESPAVQPESAPADACSASDPTPGEQSATLPTADSYSFADGFETKIGRQFCRPIRMWTGGQSIFIPPRTVQVNRYLRMKKKVIVNPKIAKIDGQGSKPPPSVLGLQSVNKAN